MLESRFERKKRRKREKVERGNKVELFGNSFHVATANKIC